MASPRYLIGGGERLSEVIARAPRGTGEKAHPYTFDEARARLAGEWTAAVDQLEQLPQAALPLGQAAIAWTLHPSYLAKSYYPANLIRELRLTHLGSRAVHVHPDTIVSARDQSEDRPLPAPLLYLGGPANLLRQFGRAVADWSPADEHLRDDFRKLESVALPGPDRVKLGAAGEGRRGSIPVEVVLHLGEFDEGRLVTSFGRYLESLDLEIGELRRRSVGGLCFVGMRAPVARLPQIAEFAFLRALRPMPQIGPLDPPLRMMVPGFRVTLLDQEAAAPDLSVAIFDGGLPENHGLGRWVTAIDAPGVGPAFPAAVAHGLAVTSAFLFGPLQQGTTPARPFANVDHWRVIGAETAADDFQMFEVLNRIEDAVSSRRYDFINISLGPRCSIDDDDVNVWTSTLDALLASGDTVATIASGNDGELDVDAGLHRIQPPSDGVNMIAVGAADCIQDTWVRAPYSSYGPGRSPGYVKPDLVAFGGSHASPFLVLTNGAGTQGGGTAGTSFSAPLAMRSAAGVRAQFNDPLWAPTVKALMVHQAKCDDQDRCEVGWGRLSHNLGDLVLCDDGEAHVIYQRAMPDTGTVRMYLPVPPGIPGLIEIQATFSFYCDINPEDALNYTTAGLEIQFRPDLTDFPPPYMKDGNLITPTVPKSDSFFTSKDFYLPEYRRRDDAQKWETTLTRTKRKRGSSLNQAAFDVSRVVREHGHVSRPTGQMIFAMVLSLRSRQVVDLYDRVVAYSAGRLQPMRPRAGVLVPTRT